MGGLCQRRARLGGRVRAAKNLLELLLLLATVLPSLGSTAEAGTGLYAVRHLVAQPDFREVRLRWETDGDAPASAGFVVHYCELQPWGAHRCRVKAVDGASGREAVQGGGGGGSGARLRLFWCVVSGLRIDTNYTMEVRPANPPGAAAKARGETIAVATRGFSARATLCLPEASEVEVVTGPHFGGRVAAERGGARCALDGDARSARAVYLLRLDHAACGGARNATAVATYVTVQESAALLTHSTRRFLVICSFQPDTLTVRAGIRLPVRGNEVDNEVEASGGALDGGAADGGEVARVRSAILPYADAAAEGAPEAAEVLLEAGAAGARAARLLHHRSLVDEPGPEAATPGHSSWQLTMMLALTSAGLVGCALSAWWFSPTGCRRPPELADDGSSLSAYENLTNSLRDTASVSSVASSCGGRCAVSECDAGGAITIRLGAGADDEFSTASTACHRALGGATSDAASAPPPEPCITLEHASQSEA